MRKVLWVPLCVLWAATMSAQSAKDAFDAFRDSVVHKNFMLRNFSGAAEVHAVWTSGALHFDEPRWRTFAELQVKSAKMHGSEVRLECERRVLAWNEQHQLAPYNVIDLVQIEVELGNGDAAQILPQLRDQLFYSSTEDALAAIPKPLRNMVPAHENKLAPNPGSQTKRCDCGEADPCATAKDAQGLVLPKPLHTADAKFSDEGRSRKINGNILTAFMVDEAGNVRDVWVARPLGYGMDEEAAKAVLSYAFRPATCHGTPISVPLATLTNFQTF